MDNPYSSSIRWGSTNTPLDDGETTDTTGDQPHMVVDRDIPIPGDGTAEKTGAGTMETGGAKTENIIKDDMRRQTSCQANHTSENAEYGPVSDSDTISASETAADELTVNLPHADSHPLHADNAAQSHIVSPSPGGKYQSPARLKTLPPTVSKQIAIRAIFTQIDPIREQHAYSATCLHEWNHWASRESNPLVREHAKAWIKDISAHFLFEADNTKNMSQLPDDTGTGLIGASQTQAMLSRDRMLERTGAGKCGHKRGLSSSGQEEQNLQDLLDQILQQERLAAHRVYMLSRKRDQIRSQMVQGPDKDTVMQEASPVARRPVESVRPGTSTPNYNQVRFLPINTTNSTRPDRVLTSPQAAETVMNLTRRDSGIAPPQTPKPPIDPIDPTKPWDPTDPTVPVSPLPCPADNDWTTRYNVGQLDNRESRRHLQYLQVYLTPLLNVIFKRLRESKMLPDTLQQKDWRYLWLRLRKCNLSLETNNLLGRLYQRGFERWNSVPFRKLSSGLELEVHRLEENLRVEEARRMEEARLELERERGQKAFDG